MYDYLLVYYMLTTTAALAQPLPGHVQTNHDAYYRAPAISVQERFGSLDSCRIRVNMIRGRVALTNVPSERFELECHPVPRQGGAQLSPTS